jgi:hypothetical protein
MIPREFVMAEVAELAHNQARRCSLCGRQARFLPTRAGTLVRAAGRGWSDRCSTCVLAPNLVSSVLTSERPAAEFRRQVRHYQAGTVLAQVRDIEKLPPSDEREQALQMLYLQLQQLADELVNEGTPLRVIAGGRAPLRWSAEAHATL